MAPAMVPAAIVALLVLLAAPAHAGRPWLDSDFARIGRDLLTSVANNGNSCPPGYFKPPETPPAVPAFTSATANSPTLTWGELYNLGWDLPATRPTTSEWYTTYANGIAQYSSTFWSVQCNGRGFVTADGRGCTNNKGPDESPVIQEKTYGATHVRYNCTTQSFWILTYAFADKVFDLSPGAMWAITCSTTATTLDTCDSGGNNKFLQLPDSATTPQAAGTCGGQSECEANTPTSDWCCQDMWAIVGGVNNQDWFGWLGQARFQLPGNTNTSYAQAQVHFNSNGVTTTQSNARNLSFNGMCLACGGQPPGPPPPSDTCVPPSVTVTPPDPVSVCSDATEQLMTYYVDTNKRVNISVTPANCQANVTKVLAGGGGVEVNCTAPWSGPFRVLLAVVGDCEFAEASGVDVTVNAKPTVTATLVDQDTFICSTDDTAVYSFHVNTDVGGTQADPISVTIEGDADNACLFDNLQTSTTALNDTVVSVTCSKPTEPGWSTSLGFSLVATYGLEGCRDTDSASASTSVTPVPIVGVEIDEAGIKALCDADDDEYFTFNARVYNYGTSLAKLTVSASWIYGPSLLNCTVTPDADVGNAAEVVVACEKPEAGYVAGTYTLTVSAQAGVDGCSDTASNISTLTINAKPAVTINGATTGQEVCEDDQSFSFTCTFGSNPAGNLALSVPSECNNFTYMSGSQAVNTATATAIPAGDVTITCNKGAAAKWTGPTFEVGVTATAGATDCINSTGRTNVITINRRPVVRVTSAPKLTRCSSGTSGTYEFWVTGLSGFEDTAVFTPDWSRQFNGLNCSQVTQDASAVMVTCTTTEPTLPERFNVSLTVSAGATSCTGSSSATTEAYVPCCGGGEDTTYAAVGVDTSLRSTNGNSTCFFAAGDDWRACGDKGNWGWRNRFSGPGTVDAAIYAGAAVTCKKTSKRVGTITATCSENGFSSNVTFSSLDNFGITPRDNHIYVGCANWLSTGLPVRNRSPTCTPSTFGGVSRPSGTGMVTCGGNEKLMPGVGRCGGNGIPTSFAGFSVPGCNCNGIVWIFHQADNNWNFARQSDGSCRLPT